MTSYIITEELIDYMSTRVGMNKEIWDKLRSHPYNPQAERTKVLDELEKRVDAETYEVEDRHNCRSIKNHIEHSDVKKIIEKLRQEGKEGE